MRYVPLDDLKQTSIHILGAAGYGKSFFLRHLIDQLILHRQPFGVLDPHTELFEYALNALRLSGISPGRIVVLDPSRHDYVLGFDPLQPGVGDADEVASLVLDAFLKVWGATSFDQTPRLEGILRGLFRLLIDSGLSLLEATDVLNVDNRALRAALRSRTDDWVRGEWEEFEKLPRTDKLIVVESSRYRLRRFMQTQSVRLMFGQIANPLKLTTILNEGKHLLANLGAIPGPETQRLVGTLITNAVYHAAKRRDTRQRSDWFLIVDEFANFATGDFARSLDELRKFGVHVVVSHQRLHQLEREDADIASAVMTNAKVKVIFGGLARPEAERMAKELGTGAVRGNRVKHVTTQTKFRPIPDTFTVESENSSENETRSGTSGNGSHDLRSHSRGSGLSVVPITVHEEFREETGRQFWSVEEEWERLIARVHGLAKREVLVRVYNGPLLHLIVPEVTDRRDEGASQRFAAVINQRSPFTEVPERVRLQIAARREQMARMTAQHEEGARPFNPQTYRE
jgi:hypothetical protein